MKSEDSFGENTDDTITNGLVKSNPELLSKEVDVWLNADIERWDSEISLIGFSVSLIDSFSLDERGFQHAYDGLCQKPRRI